MKILYVITGMGLGGAEKVVADLADQMILRGHDVKIAYLKGTASVKPVSNKVELIPLSLESITDLSSASKKYRKLIKAYQPDIVHAHMVHANIFTRLNRIICKIPKLICTAHSSNEGGSFRMFAYKITNFLSNLNTNVSKTAVQEFIKKKAFSSKNLQVIYNGIDLSRFKIKNKKNQANTISFLSVGRLNDAKDYPNLFNAISIVIEKYPNADFYIAGEGSLEKKLLAKCYTLNIEKHVTFLGRRDDIPELMAEADFFILSSKYEGFGLVVAEAMACGTFVVATDCGGVKEVMGGNGILVPPQDSEQLAKAIITALSMPHEEVIENNKKAKQHVSDNFDLVKIVDQWEEIYAK